MPWYAVVYVGVYVGMCRKYVIVCTSMCIMQSTYVCACVYTWVWRL